MSKLINNNDIEELIAGMYSDLIYFIPFANKAYKKPLHLKPLVNELNDILYKGIPKQIIVTLPPRHYKTETLIYFIALHLILYPEKTICYVSYSSQQAESKTLKACQIALEHGVKPNPKMQNRNEWRTVQGGGILTTGIGGSLTGQGADIMVIDDPVKDYEEAYSKTFRERNWNWFETVAETRLEPNASIIIVQTRWHEDDLAGRVIKERDYKVIRIPALCDNLSYNGKFYDEDLLNRKLDEPLCKERYSFETLDLIRTKKPYTYMSLYQGLPRAKEGYLFTSDVTYYTELPSELQYSIGCDLAYTEKTHADFSTVVVFAKHKPTNKFYIIEAWRWQKEFSFTKAKLKHIQDKYNIPINIEDNGVQKAICDMLQADGIRLKRITPVTDKLTRAQELSDCWNSGDVLLPNPTTIKSEWLSEYIEEMTNFTGIKDRHDDYIDSSVYAHKNLLVGEPKFISFR